MSTSGGLAYQQTAKAARWWHAMQRRGYDYVYVCGENTQHRILVLRLRRRVVLSLRYQIWCMSTEWRARGERRWRPFWLADMRRVNRGQNPIGDLDHMRVAFLLAGAKEEA